MNNIIVDPENNAAHITKMRYSMNATLTPKEIARADMLMALDWWDQQRSIAIQKFALTVKEYSSSAKHAAQSMNEFSKAFNAANQK